MLNALYGSHNNIILHLFFFFFFFFGGGGLLFFLIIIIILNIDALYNIATTMYMFFKWFYF